MAMRGCTITTSDRGPWIRVRIEGLISEDFDAREVPVELGTPERPLHIDLRGVLRFTSTGVREWIYFVRRLNPGGFVLENCSVAFVQQMNTVLNLAPASAVKSLALPWWCEPCARIEDVMVSSESALAAVAAGRNCAVCGGEMMLDQLPETYLGWLDEKIEQR
jgi:hypothetical protein